MSSSTLPDTLSQASYRIIGPQLAPRAEWRQHHDGSWLLHAPAGEWADNHPAGSLAWRSLALRADDTTPMFCQRAADGAWRCLSWAQAWQQSRSVACALLRLGYDAQKPLATLSGNSLEQAVLRLGAMLAGVPLVHLSPAYSLLSRDHAQLKAALALVPCATVFVQDARLFASALAAITAHGVSAVIAAHGAGPGQYAFDELTVEPVDESALARARELIGADSWCAVYFTSGSTGQPKAVPVTHGMLEAQRRMSHGRVPPQERRPQISLDWLPWHHVFAGVINLSRLLAAGGTYYIDEGRPVPGQFEATLRNLREVAPTSYVSSPVAFTRLAGELEADEALARHFFSRLETMAYGGASLPAETWQRMQRLAIRHTGHKLPFLCGLASTEAIAGVSLYWPCDETAVIGLPLPEVQLKLVPLDGQSSFDGRFDLRIRGQQVFKGYIGRPDLNAQAFDEDGFYRLGDAVRFVDPGDPLRGLRFDGRVAEDFKLTSGTWVRAGAVRVHAVTLLSPLISDAVVCGQDRDAVGVLAWPNEKALRALDPALGELPLQGLLLHPLVINALQDRLCAAARHGGAATIERVALLGSPPSLDAGEITDKGYVNQAAALRLRAKEVERLYANPSAPGIAIRVDRTP